MRLSIFSITAAALLALTAESVRAQNPAPAAVQRRAANAAPANEEKIQIEIEMNPAQLQVVDQLRPLLTVEIAFARRACNLSKNEVKMLSDAGEDCLKDLAKQSNVPREVGNIRGGRVIVGNVALAMPSNPRKSIQDRMSKIISEKLPAEYAAEYKIESLKRSEFQRQVAVNNTVCMIDQKLKLSEEQRQKICEALTKAWKDSDLPDQQTFINSMEYLPQFPENCVVPFLRPSQKTVWQARGQQSTVRFGFSNPNPVFEDTPPAN